MADDFWNALFPHHDGPEPRGLHLHPSPEARRQARIGAQGAQSVTDIPDWSSEWRHPGQGATHDQLLARVQKLELTIEALIHLLGHRTGLRREELALAIQRLDLADGLEDGALGPDRSATAPMCPQCNRPRNPHRNSCLYCNNADPPIDPRATAQAAAQRSPGPMVQCGGCGSNVPERNTYFTEDGLRCCACFSA